MLDVDNGNMLLFSAYPAYFPVKPASAHHKVPGQWLKLQPSGAFTSVGLVDSSHQLQMPVKQRVVLNPRRWKICEPVNFPQFLWKTVGKSGFEQE